ncbi:uncharacterized protein LOC129148066 isoform X2 [Eptesicus fuscus]|uniref:uncharacterized protein LOC129148066 isoform X2 n=1 Tax=Eptesicus fuscus TaxID=29078 RepID=UPI002403C08C|nr:uncharacterized protein LOC129148066 isoform X2 [Eptesicus fuscus]
MRPPARLPRSLARSPPPLSPAPPAPFSRDQLSPPRDAWARPSSVLIGRARHRSARRELPAPPRKFSRAEPHFRRRWDRGAEAVPGIGLCERQLSWRLRSPAGGNPGCARCGLGGASPSGSGCLGRACALRPLLALLPGDGGRCPVSRSYGDVSAWCQIAEAEGEGGQPADAVEPCVPGPDRSPTSQPGCESVWLAEQSGLTERPEEKNWRPNLI